MRLRMVFGWLLHCAVALCLMPLVHAAPGWTAVGGLGVFAQSQGGDASAVLVGFAGWSVSATGAQAWISALNGHLPAGPAAQVYAVQGPRKASFVDREIDTDGLAQELLRIQRAGAVRHIIVVAHSSGSLVAHRMLQRLHALAPLTLSAVHYFNLDGGVGQSDLALTTEVVAALGGLHTVDAVQGAMASPNTPALQRLRQLYPRSISITIPVAADRCRDRWCVHQTLITQRPHQADGFDLESDYTVMDRDHPVQAGYLRCLDAAAGAVCDAG